MKRDLNLIRMILLDIESSPPGQPIGGFNYDGRSDAEVLEHVQLLLDANFIDGSMAEGNMGQPVGCVVMRMTWTGQEFLAKAKNDTIWKKVLAQADKRKECQLVLWSLMVCLKSLRRNMLAWTNDSAAPGVFGAVDRSAEKVGQLNY